MWLLLGIYKQALPGPPRSPITLLLQIKGASFSRGLSVSAVSGGKSLKKEAANCCLGLRGKKYFLVLLGQASFLSFLSSLVKGHFFWFSADSIAFHEDPFLPQPLPHIKVTVLGRILMALHTQQVLNKCFNNLEQKTHGDCILLFAF